jgi:hypothetical protein
MLWKTRTEGPCILSIHLAGIIAPTLTAMDERGNLKLDRVGAIVDHLYREGVPDLCVGIIMAHCATHKTAKKFGVPALAGFPVRSTDFGRPFFPPEGGTPNPFLGFPNAPARLCERSRTAYNA